MGDFLPISTSFNEIWVKNRPFYNYLQELVFCSPGLASPKRQGLIYKVNRCKKPQLPLAAYEDFSAFKIFLSDIGLMCAMSNVPAQSLLNGNVLFSDFKGALTEQYVLQQLKTNPSLSIFYWSAENSRGEIDFLLEQEETILPIEVKAEENLKAKSLRSFVDQNPGLHGIRLSMSPYREQDWLTNYPLYSVLAVLGCQQ